ncbi:hypothetical protein ACROYT_G008552 [Oculina patagonica]
MGECGWVRVHAPPIDYDRLEYALETGVKVLSYYEKLFGEPFPLPKLDLLAVPDFLNGAMEEWGLVMFRRSYLVYDEQFSSTDVKLKMTKVISHELAHQWFGNLVTMRWWNDLWLNEGFAIFVEDEFGANHVFNKWNMMIWIRISDPRLPRSWYIKGISKSVLGKDSPVPLMHYDWSDLDSQILIISKEHTLKS